MLFPSDLFVLCLPSSPRAVQSPDTVSNKSSPAPTNFHTPSPDRHVHTLSVAEGINRGFASAQSLSDTGRGVSANPLGTVHSADDMGGGGKGLVDAMGSKFEANVPAGLPVPNQAEVFQNTTVKRVSVDVCWVRGRQEYKLQYIEG